MKRINPQGEPSGNAESQGRPRLSRKLILRRETIRPLDASSLYEVLAAASGANCTSETALARSSDICQATQLHSPGRRARRSLTLL
jgi:hypothetical protein